MADPEETNPALSSSDNGDLSRRQTRIQSLPKEFRNLLAGGVAGMTAKSVVAPIDRIKILYQISSVEFHLRKVPGVAANIVRNEGLPALWKGNSVQLIRVFPYSGIQFMVFDGVKMYFLRKHESERWKAFESDHPEVEQRNRDSRKWGLTPAESLAAGMSAGAVSVVCTYPLDLTRAQLAVLKRKRHMGHEQNPGFIRILTRNYKDRGFRGLFRGISPTLLGILPYSGIAFTVNEQGKRKIQHVTGRPPTTVERMQCGALAGLVAQTLTYPLEVTRRRMQTIGIVPTSGEDAAVNALSNSNGKPSTPKVDKPVSMVDTMRFLYREQGMRGFFKGVSMNWMKGPIAFSISFTVFDIVQNLMMSEHERSQRQPRH